MIPKTLHLTGFLSYKDMPEPLDLNGIHVACLSGPNGHGKSALLDGITWALWGKARGSEGGQEQERLIRDGSDTARVELTFELEGDEYRIVRERSRHGKPSLVFNIRAPGGTWTDLAGEGIADTQRKIIDRLRMDYETFVTSAYILQGRADTFTALGAAERKEVLSKILGLEIYEKLATRAKERKKELSGFAEAYRTDAERLEAELLGKPAVEEELALAERCGTEAEAERKAASAELTSAQARLVELKAVEAEAKQLERSGAGQRDTVASLAKEIAGLEEEIASLEKSAKPDSKSKALAATVPQLESQEHALEEARADDAELAAEATALQHRIALERERLAAEIRAHEQAIEAAKADIAKVGPAKQALGETLAALVALDVATAEREELLHRHRALGEERAALDAAVAQRAESRLELAERVAGLGNAGAECPLCAQPLTKEHRGTLKGELSARLAELDAAGKVAKKRVIQIDAEVKGVVARGKELQGLIARRDELSGRRASLTEAIVRAGAGEALVSERTEIVTHLRAIVEADQDSPTERKKLASVIAERKETGYEAEAHKTLRTRLTAARDAERTVAQAANAATALDGARKARAGAGERLRTAQEAIAAIERDLAGRAQVLEELPATSRGVEEITARVERAQSERVREQGHAAAARERLKVFAEKNERAKQARDEHAKAKTLASRYEKLAKAFGRDGIPARIIGNAIPELRAEANRLLGMLTDGRLTLSIDSVKETKAKTLKETLDVTVYDAAGGKRAYEMYSGGERLRIDFALRIALSRLLAHRANTRLETLVIDEGFGSQDAEGRARLVEAILRVRGDFRRILVITHLEELKDQFPVRIEVSKHPVEGSRVRVV